MIFNMMSYGGTGYGDPDDTYAVWRVTFPSGSTCTCTNGTDTLEALEGTTEVFFYIPEAGTWTASCTDGTKTASTTITFNTSTRIKATALSYEVDPGPTPPATTATIKVTASRYGAINASEVNGDWTGGDATLGTSATYTVPRTGQYIIAYVPQGGSVLYSYVTINTLGETVTVNADNGTSQSDGGPSPTPSATKGSIRATTATMGYFNLYDDVTRDPVGPTYSYTWNDITPGVWQIQRFVPSTSDLQQQTITVVAGQTTTVAFN